MRKTRYISFAAAILIAVFAIAGCRGNFEGGETAENVNADTVHATIVMEDGSEIKLELYYDKAPQSVSNFVYLARQGFYDGLTFHRVINGALIQGGCPVGDGTGDPGYCIKGEFDSNGFKNDIF